MVVQSIAAAQIGLHYRKICVTWGKRSFVADAQVHLQKKLHRTFRLPHIAAENCSITCDKLIWNMLVLKLVSSIGLMRVETAAEVPVRYDVP
jgi:hypothetical protein